MINTRLYICLKRSDASSSILKPTGCLDQRCFNTVQEKSALAHKYETDLQKWYISEPHQLLRKSFILFSKFSLFTFFKIVT